MVLAQGCAGAGVREGRTGRRRTARELGPDPGMRAPRGLWGLGSPARGLDPGHGSERAES